MIAWLSRVSSVWRQPLARQSRVYFAMRTGHG